MKVIDPKRASSGVIGIIGGVGPLAGVDLATKIIEETEASADQEHVPFVLVSLPSEVPDRTEYLLGREPVNPAVALGSLLLRVEQMGARIAAIACNTAHAPQIFDQIVHQLSSAGSALKVVHLIDNTVSSLQTRFGGQAVGILSTLGTWKFDLYGQALEWAGFSVLRLTQPWAERTHDAIYHPDYGVKAQYKPVNERARSELYAALDVLVDAGAACVILGCTEIPLCITDNVYRNVPLINPSRILARTLIAAVDPNKLRS